MSFVKKFKNPLIALVIFLVVTALYCSPVLTGKKLASHDGLSWDYISHEASSYADSTGELVMWSNSQFGGMPTFTFYSNTKSNVLGKVFNFFTNEMIPLPYMLFFYSMLSLFIMLRVFKVEFWLSILLAIGVTFVSYNPIIVAAGHINKMLTTAVFPGMIAGIHLLYQKKWWKGILLFFISIFISLNMGHQQLEYYMVFIFGCMAIYEFIRLKKEGDVATFFKSSAIIIGLGLLSLMATANNFYPLYSYTKHTMRGGESELTLNKKKEDLNKKSGGLDKDYAFSWSQGIGETFTAVVPMLYGGASGEKLTEESELYNTLTSIGVPAGQANQFIENAPTYWGNQPFVSGPVYFGVIVVFLFILAMVSYQKKFKWWIFAAVLITLFISLGNNFSMFNYFLFDNIPLFNKFRTPSMILALTPTLMILLGAVGLQSFIESDKPSKEKIKELAISGGILLLFLLVVALAPTMLFDFTSTNDEALKGQYLQAFGGKQELVNQMFTALKSDRESLASMSAWRSIFFLLASAAAIFLVIRKTIKPKIAFIAIGALVCLDLFPIANNYLNQDNYEEMADNEANFMPRPVDQEILKDKDPYYRVLDVTVNVYNDAKPAYFHKLIGGYSPAKMEAYQDLIDMQLGGQQSGGKFNAAVLNMMNTKYLITGQPGQEQIMPNPGALGNAWFVNSLKWTKNADEEMLALNASALGDTVIVQNPFNPASVAVVRDDKEHTELKSYNFTKDSSSKITLTKYGLNQLKFKSNSNSDGFGVFSDIYYSDGWKAYVDDKETPIYRVNYLLRGIKIPKGEHSIVFKFAPQKVLMAYTATFIGSIIGFIIIAFALFRIFKPKSLKSKIETK